MQDDIIHAAWREGEDPEFAVRRAREMVASIVNSTQPMDIRLALLEAAAESLLDAPGGNPILVFRAAKILASENAFLERTTSVSAADRLHRRVRLAVLQARGLHCGGESYQAFRACLATLTAIQSFADGREGLLAKMGNRPPNICAESAVAVLGITAASLRRAGLAATSRRRWTDEIRALVASYIPHLDDPGSAYIYAGTPSLIQVLYLLVQDGNPDDASLIKALHGLDKLARPADRRALATVPLREVALAGYAHDRHRVAEQSGLARERLTQHPLPRHLEAVDKWNYLDPDDEALEEDR